MPGHFIAVIKKVFLWSDHTETQADSQLRTYIRLYEAVARTAWFGFACLFGLGLGSQGQLADKALQTLTVIRNHPEQSWSEISNLAVSVLSNPPGIVLAVVTIVWHHAYLKHVKNETTIVVSCFEKDQKPQWIEVSGAKYAPFFAAWFFIAFSGLCFLVGNVRWYALVAILLNLGDFAGNEFTKNNLLKAFRNKEFRTKNKMLLAKRQIALEYWSEKWQFTRILLMFMINVFALTMSSDVFGIRVPDLIPYALVTFAILSNEYIISTWRIERDNKLNKVAPSIERDDDVGQNERPAGSQRLRPKKKRSQAQTDSGE